jgi:hypothetical protein
VLPPTVCGLAQAGIFTTKLDTKPKVQIYEKLSYEARNPRLRQTAVIGCPSVCQVGCLSWLLCRVCGWCIFIFSKRGKKKMKF